MKTSMYIECVNCGVIHLKDCPIDSPPNRAELLAQLVKTAVLLARLGGEQCLRCDEFDKENHRLKETIVKLSRRLENE